ncbi:MAG: ABC transporter ATP-binding protein [Acidobacteriota bacterium]
MIRLRSTSEGRLFDGLPAWRRFFASYFVGIGGRLALSVVVRVSLVLSTLVVVFIAKRIVDEAIPERDATLLLRLGALLVGVRLAVVLVSTLLRRFNIALIQTAVFRLRRDVVEHLYRLPRSTYSNVSNDDLQNTLIQDTTRVKETCTAVVSYLLPSAVSALLLTAVLVYLEPFLSLALLLAVPIMLFSSRAVARSMRANISLFHRAFDRFAEAARFATRALDLVHVHGSEENLRSQQVETLEDLRETEGRMTWTWAVHNEMQNGIVAAGAAIILVLGGRAVIEGDMSLGGFFVFYLVAGVLNHNGQTMINGLPPLLVGQESLVTLFRMLDLPAAPRRSSSRRVDFAGHLEVRGVRFGYGPQSVLEGADLLVEPGEHVALYGANGAGKSTLMYLLLGLYEPEEGAVLAEGTDYRELDLVHLRQSFGVVLQQPLLFSGSVRENITFGLENARQADVEWAARTAFAHEFVTSLEEGYDTQIGNEGSLLSGGQRQRLAIARALLRRPKVLFLDEPSNHLDPRTSNELFSRLSRIDGTTLVVISHDRPVLESAGRIFEVRNGGLVAGAPEVLAVGER